MVFIFVVCVGKIKRLIDYVMSLITVFMVIDVKLQMPVVTANLLIIVPDLIKKHTGKLIKRIALLLLHYYPLIPQTLMRHKGNISFLKIRSMSKKKKYLSLQQIHQLLQKKKNQLMQQIVLYFKI